MTRPLFSCPRCCSRSVLAIAAPVFDGRVSFEACCRACALVEFAVLDDGAEPAIMTRWLSPPAIECVDHTPIHERTCHHCGSTQLEIERASSSPETCVFCGHVPSAVPVWN